MPSVGSFELLVILVISVFWFAVIGLLAYGAVTLVRRRGSGDARGSGAGDPAMDDLRVRFARGEIDDAEYQRRLAVLQGR